ncbi:MAG: hypothetical protein R3220_03800 [Balneolaceae bacterium]|nr:hypothetical protein [Balneolaceae bacterium]
MNDSRNLISVFIAVLFLQFSATDIAQAQITPGDPVNFITTWKSDNPGNSENDEIIIPTNSGSTYDYDVYWEDVNDAGNNGTLLDNTGDLLIDFDAEGTYRIEITGLFPRILFLNADDPQKILTIEQGEI